MAEPIYHATAPPISGPPIFTDHRSAIVWAAGVGAFANYEAAKASYTPLYEAHQGALGLLWSKWIALTVVRLGGPVVKVAAPPIRFERKAKPARTTKGKARTKRPLHAGSEQKRK